MYIILPNEFNVFLQITVQRKRQKEKEFWNRMRIEASAAATGPSDLRKIIYLNASSDPDRSLTAIRGSAHTCIWEKQDNKQNWIWYFLTIINLDKNIDSDTGMSHL